MVSAVSKIGAAAEAYRAYFNSSIPIVLFAPIQGIDTVHFSLRQFKAESVQIFTDVIGIAGTGDDHHALLQIPTQDHLSGGHAMIRGNCRDRLIAQHFPRVAPSAEGIPCLLYTSRCV